MTHFDIAEARTMARAHRAAAPYDRLAIKLMQACEEIERLRQALRDAQREQEQMREGYEQSAAYQIGSAIIAASSARAALEARDD